LTRLRAEKAFASSPGLAESSEQIDCSSAGEASGEYQSELSRFLIGHQGSSFLPGSSLRALSGRVAHPPERLAFTLIFRALRPTRPANCQRPAHLSRHNPRAPRSRVDMSPTTCCGSRRPREEPIGSRARPDSTARCGRAATCGIDSGRTRRSRFGPSHRDGGNRTPSEELAAIRR
jgi:hypothetical protein